MLADIERMQMQTEGAQLQQQRIHQLRRDALAAVLRQAGAQQQQILAKLCRVAVWLQRPGCFGVSVQPLLHARQKAAVLLQRIALRCFALLRGSVCAR